MTDARELSEAEKLAWKLSRKGVDLDNRCPDRILYGDWVRVTGEPEEHLVAIDVRGLWAPYVHRYRKEWVRPFRYYKRTNAYYWHNPARKELIQESVPEATWVTLDDFPTSSEMTFSYKDIPAETYARKFDQLANEDFEIYWSDGYAIPLGERIVFNDVSGSMGYLTAGTEGKEGVEVRGNKT